MNAISGRERPLNDDPDTVILSVLVPLYKRHKDIVPIHAHLTAALAPLDIRYELVLIDDGSTDDTRQALEQLAARDPAVTAVLLENTAGKEAALQAGLAQAAGQAVIIMEGQLHSAAELVPRMLAAWRAGAQVVNTRRTAPRRALAILLCRLVNLACDADMTANAGDFQLLGPRARDGLTLIVNRKRFMHPLFDWMGLDVAVIDYDDKPHTSHTRRVSLSGALGWALKRRVSFFSRLSRALIVAGLLAVPSGALFNVWNASMLRIMGSTPADAIALSPAGIVLSGALLFCLGMLGKRLCYWLEPLHHPSYHVRKVIRHS